jgi:hypothetical protein
MQTYPHIVGLQSDFGQILVSRPFLPAFPGSFFLGILACRPFADHFLTILGLSDSLKPASKALRRMMLWGTGLRR